MIAVFISLFLGIFSTCEVMMETAAGIGQEVLVTGAGPVGLLAAAFLGQAGIPVLVADARPGPSGWSRAIGVSPPSLDILSRLGLAGTLVSRGRKIEKVQVHSPQRLLGRVDFRQIGGNWPFMLSVGQAETEAVLREYLESCPTVRLCWNTRVELAGPENPAAGGGLRFRLVQGPVDCGLTGKAGAARAGGPAGKAGLAWGDGAPGEDGPAGKAGPAGTSGAGDAAGPWAPDRDVRFLTPSMVLVCEGARSSLRSQVEPSTKPRYYKDAFVMADHPEDPALGDEARLFFTWQGAVESFPVGGGSRRWIVQTGRLEPAPPKGFVAATLSGKVGTQLSALPDPAREYDVFPFRVMKLCMKDYHHRRGKTDLLFLGDAAHLMPPIGGQGMNTGFGDVDWFLPQVIRAFREGRPLDAAAVRALVRLRRRAWRVAERRAWLSLRLGTVRGRLPSALRNVILFLMLNGPAKARVPRDYAMLSIPGCCRKDE